MEATTEGVLMYADAAALGSGAGAAWLWASHPPSCRGLVSCTVQGTQHAVASPLQSAQCGCQQSDIAPAPLICPDKPVMWTRHQGPMLAASMANCAPHVPAQMIGMTLFEMMLVKCWLPGGCCWHSPVGPSSAPMAWTVLTTPSANNYQARRWQTQAAKRAWAYNERVSEQWTSTDFMIIDHEESLFV